MTMVVVGVVEVVDVAVVVVTDVGGGGGGGDGCGRSYDSGGACDVDDYFVPLKPQIIRNQN